MIFTIQRKRCDALRHKSGDEVGIDFPSCSDAGDPSHFFYGAALKRGFGKANIAPVCTI